MSWENNLLEASYRGVTFDCLSTDDAISRAVASHAYPYKDGAELEDMGGESSAISISAIFFGDDYEIKLQQFLNLLEKPGVGELVHPVFGALDVQFIRANIQHDPERPDSAMLSIQFMRPLADQPLFHQTLTIQKAEAIQHTTAVTSALVIDLVEQEVAQVVEANDVIRTQKMRGNMLDMLNQTKANVAGFISTVTDPMQDARGWANDLSAAMTGILDLRDFSPVGLLADVRSIFASIDSIILLPFLGNSGRDQDVSVVNLITAITKVNAKADAIGLLLASESQTPTLSAPDIEDLTNTVREELQANIDDARETYHLQQQHPVADALKTSALSVQTAAKAIIELRPPLVTRQSTGRANYRLLAHYLYNDHTRADELFRLNPQINTPNHLGRGDSVNAYAK